MGKERTIYDSRKDDNDGSDYECERENLKAYIPGEIVAYGSVGTWRGRVFAIRRVARDGMMADILFSRADHAKWYADQYNVKSEEWHHDGVNTWTYRVIPNFSPDRIVDKIMSGEASESYIWDNTWSLRPYVAYVYGWPGVKKQAERP